MLPWQPKFFPVCRGGDGGDGGGGDDGFEGGGFDDVGFGLGEPTSAAEDVASAAATADAIGFGGFDAADVATGFGTDPDGGGFAGGFALEGAPVTNPGNVQAAIDAIDANNSIGRRAFNIISPIDIKDVVRRGEVEVDTQLSVDPLGAIVGLIGGPVPGAVVGAFSPDVTVNTTTGEFGLEGGIGSLGSFGGPGSIGSVGPEDGFANDLGGSIPSQDIIPQVQPPPPQEAQNTVFAFDPPPPPVAQIPNITFPSIPEDSLAAFRRRMERFGI